MRKKQEYVSVIGPLLEAFPKKGSVENIRAYLSEMSDLPGPRANLELAEAFAETIGSTGRGRPTQTWDLCSRLAGLSPSEAAQNTPGEFVAFCGVRCLGALGTMSDKLLGRALGALKKHAVDDRWRVRESVAASIQKLLVSDPEEVPHELEGWIKEGRWLEMRAVVAGIAEPALMKDARLADAGLRLHMEVLGLVLRGGDGKSTEFRALRQALGYSLSVIAVANPKDSFAYMRELAKSGDPDALWIVRENLKKDRLRRNFPKEVKVLGGLVEEAPKQRRV